MARRSAGTAAVRAHGSWSPPGERVSGPAPFAGAASSIALPGAGGLPPRCAAQISASTNDGASPLRGLSVSPTSPALAILLGEAYAAIGSLLLVVSGLLPMQRQGSRHLRTCRIGQRVDRYVSAPCSIACLDAGTAYALGMVVLDVGGVREMAREAGLR